MSDYNYKIFDAVAMKTKIKAALKAGHSLEDVADEFSVILNQSQKEYDQEVNSARKQDAAKALAAALSAFGKAYTGEDVPVEVDSLAALGEELQSLVRGLGNNKVVRATIPANSDDLGELAELFWHTK